MIEGRDANGFLEVSFGESGKRGRKRECRERQLSGHESNIGAGGTVLRLGPKQSMHSPCPFSIPAPQCGIKVTSASPFFLRLCS